MSYKILKEMVDIKKDKQFMFYLVIADRRSKKIIAKLGEFKRYEQAVKAAQEDAQDERMKFEQFLTRWIALKGTNDYIIKRGEYPTSNDVMNK